MASNEDILMQFNAEDNITSTVSAMESFVTGAFTAMASASSDLDTGLANLESTATNVASVFEDLSSAFDEASSSAEEFQSSLDSIDGSNIDDISSSAEESASSLEEAATSAENLSTSMDSIDASNLEDVASSADESSISLSDASDSASSLSSNLDSISAGGLSDVASEADNVANSLGGDNLGEGASNLQDAASGMFIAQELSQVGASGEMMAQQLNDANLAVSQLSTMTGIAEPELTNLINTITDAAFPREDALLYIKNLKQMGVETSNYAKSATDIDAINDAFQLGSNTTNSLATELSVLGVDMNNVSSSFNALAYANSNTKGGMENFYTFLRKYDSELNQMGYDVDQSAVIISAATQKYGGGRAALSGLSEALKNSGGDARALEEALDMQAGSLDKASQLTGAYEGQLDTLAEAELEHTTLSQQLGAVWEDLSLSLSPVLSPLLSFTGIVGQFGSFAMGVNSIRELAGSFMDFQKNGGIKGAIEKLKEFAKAKKAAETADAMGDITGIGGAGKGAGQVAKESTTVVKGASTVGALAPEAEAAAVGTTATGGAMTGIATAFTSMIVPLLAISAVIAVMIPIIAGLAAEALIFIKGIQLLIDALDFDKIDLTGAIEGIKQIGRAMLEVGIAMAEMTFANITTGLAVITTGLPGIINPIQIAGQMLIQAANELQVFNTVQIDPSIPENIKGISNALKVVADSMLSLTSVVMSMALGNLMTLGGLLGNVTDAITTAKNEITHAANEIASLKDLPDIDQGAVDKLKKVSDSLSSVAEAMEALRSLRDGQNWDNLFSGIADLFGGVDIQSALTGIRADLYKAASSLAIFKDMPSVPEGVGTKLKAVADALKSVSDSIEVLRKLRDDFNWDNGVGSIFQGVDIPGVINSIRGDLFKVSASLRTLNDMSAIPEGTGEKIKKVTSTTKTVMKAVDTLKELNSSVTGDVNLDNVITNINTANRVIRQVASRLRSLSSIANIPEGLGGKINNITNTTKKLKGSISAIRSVPQTPEGASEKVRKAVSTVKNIAKQLNNLNGTNVAGGIGQMLSSVRSAINQLKSTLSQSSGGFKSSGLSIGNGIKSGVSQSLNGLSGVVRGRVNSATGSGASAAWTGGARMGNSATRGFQSAFKIANIASSEVGYATQAIQNGTSSFVQAVGSMAEQAVQEAKNKLDQHSPGRIARMWGSEMNYSASEVTSKGAGLISSIRGITQRAVTAGNGNLNIGSAFNTDMTTGRLNALNSMNQSSNMGTPQRPVNIMIGEGAIQLDARNLTTQESRQIMINAIEGLEMVNGIDVKGA